MAQITDLTSTDTLDTDDEAILRQGTTDKRIPLELAATLSWAKRNEFIRSSDHYDGVVFSDYTSFTTYEGLVYFLKQEVSSPYTSNYEDPSNDSNLTQTSPLQSSYIKATDLTLASGQDWEGVSYTDPDAIGANPEAVIYPDGTIVGSTDNGRYIKLPYGRVWLFYTNLNFDTSSASGSQFGTTSGTTYSGTEVWTYPIEIGAFLSGGAGGLDSTSIGSNLFNITTSDCSIRNRTNVSDTAADVSGWILGSI